MSKALYGWVSRVAKAIMYGRSYLKVLQNAYTTRSVGRSTVGRILQL